MDPARAAIKLMPPHPPKANLKCKQKGTLNSGRGGTAWRRVIRCPSPLGSESYLPSFLQDGLKTGLPSQQALPSGHSPGSLLPTSAGSRISTGQQQHDLKQSLGPTACLEGDVSYSGRPRRRAVPLCARELPFSASPSCLPSCLPHNSARVLLCSRCCLAQEPQAPSVP